MNSVIKIRGGIVRAIYDDKVHVFLRKLGKKIVVKRATHVEYVNAKGKWVATLADMGEDNIGTPGTVIAETVTRGEAIDKELEFLAKKL